MAALAGLQLLRLLWFNRPGWMLSGSRPEEPIMPSISSHAASDVAANDKQHSLRVEGQINVISGLPTTGPIRLPANHFSIGRFHNKEHSILVGLDERSVSRQHATFQADGIGLYYLTDTQSSYGTYLRKGSEFERLPAGVHERLYNGDTIRFGQYVTVRFELPGDTRGSATEL